MTYRFETSGILPSGLQIGGDGWSLAVDEWPSATSEAGRPVWKSYGIGAHHFANEAYGDVDAWTQRIADMGVYAFRSGAFSKLDQVKRAAVRARQLGLKWIGIVASEKTTESELRANLQFVLENADVFIAVEGINEPDGEGLTDAEVEKTVRFQRIIWEFVTSHPELSHITVLSPALRRPAGPKLYQLLADAGLLGKFHAVSLHHYLNGPPNLADLREHLDMVQAEWNCDRFWITETGGTTALESTDPRRNTEEALAAYSVPTVLDFLSDGRIEFVCRYELNDDDKPLSVNEAYFGVFRADGTPKPEVAAISAFLASLHDPVETFELEVTAPAGVEQWLVGRTLWLWCPGALHDVEPVDVQVATPASTRTVNVGGAAVPVPLAA